jgi:hypothetical protein
MDTDTHAVTLWLKFWHFLGLLSLVCAALLIPMRNSLSINAKVIGNKPPEGSLFGKY